MKISGLPFYFSSRILDSIVIGSVPQYQGNCGKTDGRRRSRENKLGKVNEPGRRRR
jgi:hypothetical protein